MSLLPHLSIFSKDFFSVTAESISLKFHMQPPGREEKKLYIFNPVHMTKLAAMPIYGKNLTKLSLITTTGLITLKLGV